MRTDEALARTTRLEEGGVTPPDHLAGARQPGVGSARSAVAGRTPGGSRTGPARASVTPQGTGDCYVVAGRTVIFEGFPGEVVHGEAIGRGPIEGLRFGHAWIESGGFAFDFSNGGQHVMPIADYYALGQIDASTVRRYSRSEVNVWIARTHQWGPWE